MMAVEQIPKKDWYSILGADPSASVSDLKQKYQKLVLMYHPDKQSADVPAGTVEECIQKFIEIDQAWKILGNEETKKEYDLQRHGGASENNHLSYESYIYCNHAEAGQPLNSATSWGQYHRQTY
ncbi:dnaJ homolog subfamily C member 24 isoform X4 [Mirounga angustirostris]|uniref:dnaJ homolog subfamily C member 24 isoform X4 n=1 Tax=Mirounga angustirostris TaxID=9716 RepID=UPI00313C7A07